MAKGQQTIADAVRGRRELPRRPAFAGAARWLPRPGALPIWLLVLFATVLLVTPVAVLLLTSISDVNFGFIGNFTLRNFANALTSESSGPLLRNTIVYTVASTLLTMLIASPLAWIVTSTSVPAPRILTMLIAAPLLFPALLKDTSWIQLYSPKSGLVNLGLMHALGLGHPPFDIYTMQGMVIDVGTQNVPIAFLILCASMRSVNVSLYEASKVCGAGRFRTLRKIAIPVITPGVLSATVLTALIVSASFETPIVIGGPGGVRTYMSTIYASIARSSVPDFNLAAAQADLYVFANTVLLVAYLMLTRREHKYVSIAGRGYSPIRAKNPRWWVRGLLLVPPLAYFCLAFVQLAAQAVLVSLSPFYTVTNGFPYKSFSLTKYASVLTDHTIRQSIINSVVLSTLVMLASVAIALVLAAVAFQSRVHGRRTVELLGAMPLAAPPLVFSVAVLITVLYVPGLSGLYGTIVPMVVVEWIIFLPYALRVITSSVIQIPSELGEAAAASGAHMARRLRTITMPMVRPSILGGMFIVFVLGFRELGGVALLTASDTPIVPTQALNLYFQGKSSLVSALNIVTVLVPGLLVAVAMSLHLLYRWVKSTRHWGSGTSAGASSSP